MSTISEFILLGFLIYLFQDRQIQGKHVPFGV